MISANRASTRSALPHALRLASRPTGSALHSSYGVRVLPSRGPVGPAMKTLKRLFKRGCVNKRGCDVDEPNSSATRSRPASDSKLPMRSASPAPEPAPTSPSGPVELSQHNAPAPVHSDLDRSAAVLSGSVPPSPKPPTGPAPASPSVLPRNRHAAWSPLGTASDSSACKTGQDYPSCSLVEGPGTRTPVELHALPVTNHLADSQWTRTLTENLKVRLRGLPLGPKHGARASAVPRPMATPSRTCNPPTPPNRRSPVSPFRQVAASPARRTDL
jgi:hypothetical protein